MQYVEELFVRASLNVILTKPGTFVPYDYGSGCIVVYKDRNFFLSVAHVTKKGLDVFIEPNQPHDGKTSPIIPIGGILSYKRLTVSANIEPEDLEEYLENGGTALDFSVSEILEPLDLLQNDIDFQSFKVTGGTKLFPYLEHAVDPNTKDSYGFFGYINQDLNGLYVERTPEIKAPITFHRKDKDLLIFKAKKTIKTREEYAGLSGAPIFDYQGRLTALACAVRPGTNMIYAFPMLKCIELIDMGIEAKQL